MGAWGISTGDSFGSQSLAGPGSRARGPALRVGRAPAGGRRLRAGLAPPRAAAGGAAVHPLAALACVLAFTACNKVLSPQYMCWTFPLVALVVVGRAGYQRLDRHPHAGRDRPHPGRVPRPVLAMVALEPGPVAVVVMRNVVLVAAAIAAVVALWKLPADGRRRASRRPHDDAASAGEARRWLDPARPPDAGLSLLPAREPSRRRARTAARFSGRARIAYHDCGPAAARPALRRRASVLPTAPG